MPPRPAISSCTGSSRDLSPQPLRRRDLAPARPVRAREPVRDRGGGRAATTPTTPPIATRPRSCSGTTSMRSRRARRSSPTFATPTCGRSRRGSTSSTRRRSTAPSRSACPRSRSRSRTADARPTARRPRLEPPGRRISLGRFGLVLAVADEPDEQDDHPDERDREQDHGPTLARRSSSAPWRYGNGR